MIPDQEALVDALVARLDGLADFAAGRVAKRDLQLFDPDNIGWKTGLAAAVVWKGPGVAVQREITGNVAELSAGQLVAHIQIGMPADTTTTWPTRWEALQQAVLVALCTATWVAGHNWFNIEVRWGEEPPTWRKFAPAPNGPEMWFSVSVVEL
jgi:hypothetical protein